MTEPFKKDTSRHIIALNLFDLGGEGFHPMLDILINNVSYKAILDTGASRTAFDLETLRHTPNCVTFLEGDVLSSGLGTNSMTCYTTIIDLSIGDLVLNNYKATALDLSNINIAYAQRDIEPIVGVIGCDILKQYKAVIDFGEETLTL